MRALLLDALACANENRPPVWLMRQAGRYMPEYQSLRVNHSLKELFHRPELAAKVTMLPITLLDVDAAILFSDILVIAESLGLSVEFPDQGGPRIVPRVESREQVDAMPVLDVKTTLGFVFETIGLVREKLTVPLIGFCGGPFTVATYFIGSTSKDAHSRTKQWLREDPESFHRLLGKITEASIAYLQEQVNAGAQALQVFDSWASILSLEQFHIFCLPYLHRITAALKERVPVTLFCRDASLRCAELATLNPSCISLDEGRPLAELRASIPSHIAVQGNIAPEMLRSPLPEIRRAVEELLSSMRHEKGFIVNLGHGVLPDIPFAHVKYFVDLVKSC
jgi:uroporphyrinogen decarboxylase